MKRLLLLLLLLLLPAGPAFTVTPDERLADPALEARARAISRELRCVVCQNESVDESNAALARDVRLLLRERLVAGDSDAAAIGFLVARYGDFVLLRPPLRPETWVLWYGPFVLLVLAAGGTWVALRRRAQADGPPPLSAEERARIDRILREDEG